MFSFLKLAFFTGILVTLSCGPLETKAPFLHNDSLHLAETSSPLSDFLPSPVTDPNFLTLKDGTPLHKLKVRGQYLSLKTGEGVPFTSDALARFKKIKTLSQDTPNAPIQWSLIRLSDGHRIAQSLSPQFRFYGASVSKVFVAATLLDIQNGKLTPQQLDLMAAMLVVSDNNSWSQLQMEIGNGSNTLGQTLIHEFTQRFGYLNTRGYRGSLNGINGNALCVSDLSQFLSDTYTMAYAGAETVWKFLFTSRPGIDLATKYFPKTTYIGGKNGVYKGKTTDPNIHYEVDVYHHLIAFEWDGLLYGIAILTNRGYAEDVALLARGLVHTYLE